MGRRDILFLAAVLIGAGSLAAGLRRQEASARAAITVDSRADDQLAAVVGKVDRAMARSWDEKRLIPAAKAPDLALMRRLSLALDRDHPFAGANPAI